MLWAVVSLERKLLFFPSLLTICTCPLVAKCVVEIVQVPFPPQPCMYMYYSSILMYVMVRVLLSVLCIVVTVFRLQPCKEHFLGKVVATMEWSKGMISPDRTNMALLVSVYLVLLSTESEWGSPPHCLCLLAHASQ